MKSVAIVLATYRPNWQYFIQQLQSLNEQTYENCVLYVRDDSASEEYAAKIKTALETYIHNMPVHFSINEYNIGSTATFERLTQSVFQDYIAYCDQDDIWHPHKIETLLQAIEQQKGVLAYSDMEVIDEKGDVLSKRFSLYNKRIVHQSGENTFPFFIRRNCVTGCTMLLKTEVAKQALPFYEAYVHDHWLALVASTKGRIVCIDDALISYRIHGQNQIGRAIFKRIDTIDQYASEKLELEKVKFEALADRLTLTPTQQQYLQEEQQFQQTRIEWFTKPSLSLGMSMASYFGRDRMLIGLEIAFKILPKTLANRLLWYIKNKK